MRPYRPLIAFAIALACACSRAPDAALSGAACNPADAWSAPASPAACGTPVDPGPAPLRRVPAPTLVHAASAAFPESPVSQLELPPLRAVGGFTNNADADHPTPRGIEARHAWARRTAEAVAIASPRVPCAGVASEAEPACMRDWFAKVALELHGRPPSDADLDRWVAAWARLRESAQPHHARAALVEALLLSPRASWFLENVEPGTDPIAKLDGWSLARRLAAFLANGPPDETLRAAVRDGRLSTREDVEREARRLLARPGAREIVRDFHRQWLELDRVGLVTKGSLTPEFSQEVRESLVEETLRFSEWAVFDADGRLATLLGSNHAFLDDSLVRHYRLAVPPKHAWQEADLDPAQRAGVLTQGAFLAGHATLENPSPVLRGAFVRERLFCLPNGIPPPDADTLVKGDPSQPVTNRERYAAGTERGSCITCHAPINHLGDGFENYDSLGRWRDTDGGRPVDASATALGTDLAGCFDGAAALSRAFAKSEQVRRCYATHWFRYAFGRLETSADACTLDALASRFRETDGDVRELLVAIATSDAFRFRHREAP